MQVTFILRNLSDTFYTGLGESIIGLDNMDNQSKFNTLEQGA